MRRYWNRSHQSDCKVIVGKRKRKHGKKPIPVMSKLNRLRWRLIKSISQIKIQLRRLAIRVNTLQEQVESSYAERGNVIAYLRSRLNTRITIETPAGPIFGTLVSIDEDYIQISEPNGSIAIIPQRSILSIE